MTVSERRDLSWRRLKRMPPSAAGTAEDTRTILRFSVGKTFRVTETTTDGLVGLDVSPDVDHKFGGFMHEIWVEPEHLEADVPRLNAAPGRPSFGEVFHLRTAVQRPDISKPSVRSTS
jgi:hypothetical protein